MPTLDEHYTRYFTSMHTVVLVISYNKCLIFALKHNYACTCQWGRVWV